MTICASFWNINVAKNHIQITKDIYLNVFIIFWFLFLCFLNESFYGHMYGWKKNTSKISQRYKKKQWDRKLSRIPTMNNMQTFTNNIYRAMSPSTIFKSHKLRFVFLFLWFYSIPYCMTSSCLSSHARLKKWLYSFAMKHYKTNINNEHY